MKKMAANLFFTLSPVLLLYLSAFPQNPTPAPPSEEAVKIVTEEVKLNVMARSYGKFVPTLTPDDLLVVEEGTPQTITSMRRVPASVLLLLDTGGDLNFVKSAALTRLTSKILIDNLSADDAVAVIQYYDKIETVADWTNDRKGIYGRLDKRMSSGKRSRLADGLSAAVDLFKSRPPENRHLVLISDGLESVADKQALGNAFQKVLAANITVHVISYTQLEQRQAQRASRRVTIGRGETKPRVPDYIFDFVLRSLPVREEARRYLENMNEAQRIVIISLDSERIRFIRAKQEAWLTSETRMQTLADETGGLFDAPGETETMWRFAADVAGAIDSQYVITYSPTTPVTSLSRGKARKVRVSTHCGGIEIRSRQKLILTRTTRQQQ